MATRLLGSNQTGLAIHANSSIGIKNGLIQNVRVISITSSLSQNDSFVVATPTSQAITLTLPTPVVGQTIIVKRVGNYSVFINTSSGTIDGLVSFLFSSNYQAATFISDGTNWFIT